jgi:hypothetical protein
VGASVSRLAVVGSVVLALACGGPVPRTRAAGEASEAFAKVKAAHTQSVAARQVLDRAEAGAGHAPVNDDALWRARSAFDAAYATEQRTLAVFLTVALNEWPNAEETHEALSLYAESAVDNARILAQRGGDTGRAVEVLESAEHPFLALGLLPPRELTAALAEARRAGTGPPTPAPSAVAGEGTTPRPSGGRRARPARSRR